MAVPPRHQPVGVTEVNGRERILAAIGHREPDRVPVDLGATPSSGISAIAYNSLKRHLGFDEGQTLVYDVVQQLAEPEAFLLDRFGVDVIDVGRALNTEPKDWVPTCLGDGSPAHYPAWFDPRSRPDGGWDVFAPDGDRIATMPPQGTFFDQTYIPYPDAIPASLDDLEHQMGKILWAALAHSPWDRAGKPDFWPRLREAALTQRRDDDRALMIVCGCNLFEWGTFLRGIDNFLMDLLLVPDDVHRLLDRLVALHMRTLEQVCRYLGDVVDVIRFGDDLGMDSGPFMAPATYRELFKPRHRQLCDYVKAHSSMHTFLHSCGSIYQLLPDLIEAGFDVINPVQTSSADMDPRRLKQEFGSDICFWGGGCDTRSVLNRGTPQQVRDHVRERLEIFMPGGGFVFNPIHNILPDVPPANVLAMFETVADFPG